MKSFSSSFPIAIPSRRRIFFSRTLYRVRLVMRSRLRDVQRYKAENGQTQRVHREVGAHRSDISNVSITGEMRFRSFLARWTQHPHISPRRMIQQKVSQANPNAPRIHPSLSLSLFVVIIVSFFFCPKRIKVKRFEISVDRMSVSTRHISPS